MDKRLHVYLQAETAANCPKDYVEIVDGSYGSTNVIARLCTSRPVGQNSFRSKSNFLLVHMHSDSGINSNRGFIAEHQGKYLYQISWLPLTSVSGTPQADLGLRKIDQKLLGVVDTYFFW